MPGSDRTPASIVEMEGERGARSRDHRALLVAAALYTAITVLLAHPLVFNAGSSAMPGDPDTDLFMWTLAWNTHAMFTNPFGLFDANIYYPHRNTLAFSENLIGSTPIAATVLLLGGSPLVALNVVALASVVLSGVGGYVLARKIHLSPAAAFVCGAACAFVPSRFYRLGQLHLTSICWIPFCLAYLHAYLDRHRRRDLLIAIGFFSLQALASGHAAVYLTVAVIIMLAHRALRGEPLRPAMRLRQCGWLGAALLAPAVLVFIPYRIVQEEFGLRRTLADWQTTPQSFVSSVTPAHQWILSAFLGPDFSVDATAHLFPGFIVPLLALTALMGPAVALVRRGARGILAEPRRLAPRALSIAVVVAMAVASYVSLAGPQRWRIGDMTVLSARDPVRAWIVVAILAALRVAILRWAPLSAANFLRRGVPGVRASGASPAVTYTAMTLVAVLLSAGPPIGLWPYVHELPGLNFIRVPSRWMLLSTVSLAILAALGFQRVSSRRPRVWAALVVLILIAECATFPLPGYRSYGVAIPAADTWLGTQAAPVIVAEVPANRFNDRLQSTYMLHSMAHWQKTVHGHSGLRTPLHEDLYAKLRLFPSEISIQALKDLGVTHVVVHPEMFEPDDWARASAALPLFASQLRVVFDDGRDRVYRLH